MQATLVAIFELKIKKMINKPILLINPGCIKQGDLIFIYYNSDEKKHRNLILDNANNISKIKIEIYNKNSFAKLFKNCKYIKEIKCTKFIGNNITDMSEMFCDCEGLSNLDISIIETNNVTNIDKMIDGCSSLKNFIHNINEMETGYKTLIKLDQENNFDELINPRESESLCEKMEVFCKSLPLPNYQSTGLYNIDDNDDDDSVFFLSENTIY